MRSTVRRIAVTWAAVSVILVFSGCAASSSSPSASSAPSTAASEAAPSTAASEAAPSTAASASPAAAASPDGHIRIGFVTRPLSNAFHATMVDGAQAAANHYGAGMTVAAPTSVANDADQANMLSSMINAGNDCLIFDPFTGLNLIDQLARASDMGLPMIDIAKPLDPDASAAKGVKPTIYLGTDDHAAGVAAGELMLELLPEGSEVAILGAAQGIQNGLERPNGFREATSGKLNEVQFVYTDATQATGLQFASQIIRAHPNLKGIFAIGGAQSLGAQQAVDQAGKSDQIKVVGIDGIQPQLELIRDGKMAGAIEQFPYLMGYQGVQACIAAVAGAEMPASAPTPTMSITKDNAAAALENYPAPADGFTLPDPFTPLLEGLGIK